MTSGEVTINITYIKSISTYDKLNLEVNNVINVLTKKLLRALNLMQINRNYYYKNPIDVQGNPFKIFQGFTFVMNAAPKGKLNVIIDLTSRVMQERNVRSIMSEIANQTKRSLGNRPREEITREIQRRVQHALSGMVVLCQYNYTTWRIDHVDWSKSLSSTFDCQGTPKSFRDYYLERYNLKVASNEFGLLVIVKKRKGVVIKETLLIPELCNPTGVTEEMKNDFRVMKGLSLHTRFPPSKRVQQINQLVGQILNDQKAREQMAKMPLKLHETSCQVPARVMGPFDIHFANKAKTRIDKNKNFLRDVARTGPMNGAVNIQKWVIVYARSNEREAKNFGRSIMQSASKMGCQMAQPQYLAAPDARRDRVSAWRGVMGQAITFRPQLLVCVVPFADPALYSFVKNVCTVQNPVVSQCVTDRSLKNGKNFNSIVGSCWKQIMHKLGKVDRQIKYAAYTKNPSFSKKPTMIVGVSISLDKKIKAAYGKQSEKKESCVGFCASWDQMHSRYGNWISNQGAHEQLIKMSRELMKQAMERFHSKNKFYPANIVVYRDGVGDSQIEKFVRVEIKEYLKAFTDLKNRPKLTVIIVQKRVQARFFQPCPQFNRSGRCYERRCDRSEFHSPEAGSIVDSQIVSPLFSDFYLVPSEAPRGACARPTRFIVVKDEMNWGSDDIQAMTNQMCYAYSNWPGPIRVPAPVMFATKLAYLFGKMVNGIPHERLRDNLFYL